MRILHTYRQGQYKGLRQSLKERGCEFFSATEFTESDPLHTISNEGAYAIDISSYGELLESYPQVAALVELFLHKTPADTIFVSDEKCAAEHSYALRTLFERVEAVSMSEEPESQEEAARTKKTLVGMRDDDAKALLRALDDELIGQDNFKAEFKRQIHSFRVFHPIGEQPVLSALFLGPSGVGKTEVARIIGRALAPGEPLPKVNFGNYSSKDALNSLIGSPRGYMGSETGELTMKLEGSDAGILLVDEFEKANQAVWNFFLDLLETGSYTDSKGEVHDMSGYVIVFTSNTPKSQLSKTFPPELLSRFNMKVNFNPLTLDEKKLFVKRYARRIAKKLIENGYGADLQEDAFAAEAVSSVDCTSTDNVRVLRNRARHWIADSVTMSRK